MIFSIPSDMSALEAARLIIKDDFINYDYERDLGHAKMLKNVFLQSALTSQLNDDIEEAIEHSSHIEAQEDTIAIILGSYRALRNRKAQDNLDPLKCGCGAIHSYENPVIYDPHYKNYYCLDCTIAHEIDE